MFFLFGHQSQRGVAGASHAHHWNPAGYFSFGHGPCTPTGSGSRLEKSASSVASCRGLTLCTTITIKLNTFCKYYMLRCRKAKRTPLLMRMRVGAPSIKHNQVT